MRSIGGSLRRAIPSYQNGDKCTSLVAALTPSTLEGLHRPLPRRDRLLFLSLAFIFVAIVAVVLPSAIKSFSIISEQGKITEREDQGLQELLAELDLDHVAQQFPVRRPRHFASRWNPPPAAERCDWVISVFENRNRGNPNRLEEYRVQTVNPNIFYRATAELWWHDFAGGVWTNFSLTEIGLQPTMDGVPFGPKSLYTWVTGDQHLSNFGAWKNRNNETVFSVNDFDQAAPYDFHIDVIRIAVSILNHGYMLGFSSRFLVTVIYAFLGTYVDTVIQYVGNDRALVFELTPKTASGYLKSYLDSVNVEESFEKQSVKYTYIDAAGNRKLLKNNQTFLESVPPELEQEIRQAFTIQHYGATLMQTGYKIRDWDNKFYRVLDVARRLGAGIGSYGVDRFYVLLNGDTEQSEGQAVILDVKYEPKGALSNVLSADDKAWYDVQFSHPAHRAVEGQRKLTSYTDPFTGWVFVGGRAFVVRQRSPWKSSPNLDALTDKEDFTSFMEMIAISTATSHVRGTIGKSPGQFKHMLAAALDEYRHRATWRKAVTCLAQSYHQQVLLDYACFDNYVKQNYGSQDEALSH